MAKMACVLLILRALILTPMLFCTHSEQLTNLWHSKPDKIGKLEYMVKLVADIMKSTEVLNARRKCGIMLVRLMVDLGCKCCLVSTFVMRWRYTKLLFWGVVLVLR